MAVIRIALVQEKAAPNQKDENLKRMLRYIKQASEQKADNVIVKANDISEEILIAEFDMEQIRTYRQQETWGNAYRKPQAYTDLISFEVKEPFMRER